MLADGKLINDLKELKKDNSGYDIRNLLIGSDGTLGVITAASLKTFPKTNNILLDFKTMYRLCFKQQRL